MLENLGSWTGVIVNMGLLIVGVLFFVAMMGALVYFGWINYYRYKKYVCTVYEKDTFGNIHSYDDDAAIFIKGNNKRLWLRKSNVSMPADNLPYFMKDKRRALNILKKGTKNYVFIEPEIVDNNLNFSVGEEDVNWATIEFERSSKNFGQSLIMQMMPYIVVVFSVLVVMVVYVLFIQKLDLLVEISKNLGGHLSNAVV